METVEVGTSEMAVGRNAQSWKLDYAVYVADHIRMPPISHSQQIKEYPARGLPDSAIVSIADTPDQEHGCCTESKELFGY